MQGQIARLTRIAALFETLKQVREAEAARLARVAREQGERETALLGALSTFPEAALAQAMSRRLPAIASARAETKAALDRETQSLLAAARRARTADSALGQAQARATAKAQRVALEELRIGLPSASGKPRDQRLRDRGEVD